MQILYNLWAIELFMKSKEELEMSANHGGGSLS